VPDHFVASHVVGRTNNFQADVHYSVRKTKRARIISILGQQAIAMTFVPTSKSRDTKTRPNIRNPAPAN